MPTLLKLIHEIERKGTQQNLFMKLGLHSFQNWTRMQPDRKKEL
jgi:hypothetical protein